LFRGDLVMAENKEIAFYNSFLEKCDLIFDIGAYDGHKAAAFLHFAQKVVCCEPDPHSFFFLSKRFGHSKKVALRQTAVSDQEGVERFFVDQPGSAFNTLNPKWKSILEKEGHKIFDRDFKFSTEHGVKSFVTTLDALMDEFGEPDFIKIDVEGHEKNVLQGLSRRVPCLSMEANLPYFYPETLECLSWLRHLDEDARFNYAVDEKLQLPAFISYEDFLKIFASVQVSSCEVICKMRR